MNVQTMTANGAVLRGFIRARAVVLFQVLACMAMLCAASPRQDLAGTWNGKAMPVVSFLPHAPLPVEICIDHDTVSGRIGDATITGGNVRSVPGGISRVFTHADYVITVKIEGELVRGSVVRRKNFRLYVTRDGPDLRAFAASDGSMGFPWSREDVLRKAMTVQTTTFMLKRTP